MGTCVRFPLLLIPLLLLPGVARALPFTVAGFGDSITAVGNDDGSYLSLIDSYLSPPAGYDSLTLLDHGDPADTTNDVLGRLDDWILGGGTADVVVILSGTPDTFQTLGGFGNQDYDEQVTVDNVDLMIDAILAAGMDAILVAPPPVVPPCDGSTNPTCTEIDTSLSSLSIALATLASNLSVAFVDLYDAYVNAAGGPSSQLRADGVHPLLATGDDLNAQLIAAAIDAGGFSIIPEPSTALLVCAGLVWLSRRRARLPN